MIIGSSIHKRNKDAFETNYVVPKKTKIYFIHFLLFQSKMAPSRDKVITR